MSAEALVFLPKPAQAQRTIGSAKPLVAGATDQVAGTASHHLLLRAPVLTGYVSALSEGDRAMLRKFKSLPSEAQGEVLALIHTLSDKTKAQRNVAFVHAIAEISDEPFRRIWDNPKDAEYDDL